ncbi:MAG: hypothetical protein ACTSYR_01750 [Candidatus Odinarchaeia archaeon]
MNKLNLKNVELIESGSLPTIHSKINLVLFANVLHELPNPKEYINWSYTNSDHLIIIDWIKKEMNEGPQLHDRISSNEVISMLEKRGLKLKYLIFILNIILFWG